MVSVDNRFFIPVPDIDEVRRTLVQLMTGATAASGVVGFLGLWFVAGEPDRLVFAVPAAVWVLVVVAFGLRSDFSAQAAHQARRADAVFAYAADAGGRVDLPDRVDADPNLWAALTRAGVVVDGHGHRFRIVSVSIDGHEFVALEPVPNLEAAAAR